MINRMFPFIRKHRLKLVLLLIIALGGVYLIRNNPFVSARDKDQEYTVTRSDQVKTLTLTGTLEARESTALRFQTSGRLAWMGVAVGDRVKKGQALAALDQRDLRNRLSRYLNTYMKSRYDFDQELDDSEKTSTTGLNRELRDEAKRAIEKAQYDLNNSVLDVELQALTIQYATLVTPIAGIITRIDKPYVGENITAATAEIEVINPDTLYFSVTADQTEVIELTRGMRALLILDPFPEASFSGTVNDIGFTPMEGESNTVYEVKVDLTDTPHRDALRIGMTGDATFATSEKKDIITVPVSYIKTEDNRKYVFVKTGKGREKRYVETGLEFDTSYEIVSGVFPGDVLYD